MTRKAANAVGQKTDVASVFIDLDQYVPSFLTSITNKWTNTSSELYRRKFQLGMVEWRLMALLAVEPWIQASRVNEVVGMDKAAVSRAVPTLQQRGLINTRLNSVDPRRREMALTARGLQRYHEIAALALAREEKMLSGLTTKERDELLRMLRFLLRNLRLAEP